MNRGSKAIAAALVAAIGAGAATAVSAAEAKQATISVNGNEVIVRSIVQGGSQLLSAADLAHALGAELEVLPGGAGVRVTLGDRTLLLQAGSKQIQTDEGPVALSSAVTSWKQVNYIEPGAYAAALGATWKGGADGWSIETLDLLDAVDSVQWAGSGLIASVTTEDGRLDYIVDPATGARTQLLTSNGASELVVSPDGASAAFADADGVVRIVDLAARTMRKLGTDTSIKSNLQWAPDGKSLFFLQGDKTSVIAAISLEDGKVSKVLDDKVEYKGDLSVNGAGLTYSVVKTGKVTADANKDVSLDDVAIDLAGTSPQLFDLALGAADAKPAALTKGDEDKLFIQRSASGTVYYVKAGDEKTISTLVSQKGEQAKTAFDKEDVLEAVQAGSFIGILTETSVYVLDESTEAVTKLAAAPEGAYGLTLSKDGKRAALIADGRLQSLGADGRWTTLSK
ncbi:stalk domain-containing protein [Paenibacillus pasadenensis]|uniref:Copper amine oxidase-like N-terminal domain-containing protein n=1 Tax=Paenibacillus pasadenensis TaxID=217090 RepID=A0A2N5N7S9_9BACL|nr:MULTISPECIES: stalk domain-containing protein [Paenibacillus]PLT46407.1 hypothetical protein B8V81_4838 [Paenibacillus pasadenensis]QGG56843.1 hypothetical protein GE073_15440 [Paenibacillus sp. B01]